MSSRLLWPAVAVILIVAAIIYYFATSATTNQPANERPSPHAINQG